MKNALLLSGGMDSISLAWWKRPDVAVTINYGQLAAEAEISSSIAVCKRLGIQHHVVNIDCRSLGSGDMAGSQASNIAPASDWWPFRNQLLITLAAMRIIDLGISRLWLGTVKSDEGHKDGTSQFINAMNNLMSLQEGNFIVEAPAIHYSTAELVSISGVPSSLLAWAHSCHKANIACGMCRGCNKYFEVFEVLGHELDRNRQPLSS